MIQEWRERFAESCPQCPFLFVELAAFANGCMGESRIAAVRFGQHAALSLPRVAMVSAIDLGDPDSPHECWHPRVKRPIGERLAASAMHVIYDDAEGLVTSGPKYASAAVSVRKEGEGVVVSIVLAFTNTGAGLWLKPTMFCTECCPAVGGKPSAMVQVQVGGADASARWLDTAVQSVAGDTVAVSLPLPLSSVPITSSGILVNVRYAVMDFPECVIAGDAGVPASPVLVSGLHAGSGMSPSPL